MCLAQINRLHISEFRISWNGTKLHQINNRNEVDTPTDKSAIKSNQFWSMISLYSGTRDSYSQFPNSMTHSIDARGR